MSKNFLLYVRQQTLVFFLLLFSDHLLNVNLTFIQKFHSHLEPLQDIPGDDLRDQVNTYYLHFGTAVLLLFLFKLLFIKKRICQ